MKRFRQKHSEHSSVSKLSSGKLTGPQVRGRKRVRKALYRTSKPISHLGDNQGRLKKIQRAMAKKSERLNKRKPKAKLIEYRSQETPADLAKQKNDLITASLSPKKVPRVYRKLIFHYSLLRKIKSAVPKKSLTKKSVEQIISGSVTRKYRMLRYLGRETTLNRNQLKNAKCHINMKHD